MGTPAHPHHLLGFVITGAIVAIVLFIRVRRMRGERPLRLERLWIVPAIYLVFTVVIYSEVPPHGLAWLGCGVALIIGGLIGWQRGKLMDIRLDPETHQLNQRASPLAFVVILVLVAARLGARGLATEGASVGLQIDPLLVTDMLIAMALGLFAATRAEMYLRASRLLTSAKPALPSSTG